MRCWILTILVALACALPLRSQQSTKVSYEGQPVAAVDLIANPKIPVAPFRPLVQQKAGEPYSTQKIQGTLEALKKTGQFTNVELNVEPDPAGPHVIFTLEPAFYFGILQFPGTEKVFAYTRLLQVVDIPNQTPYARDAVAAARGALLEFLISNGYFQAQVQAEPQFDEAHMIANLVFHVNLGKPAKIGNVQVVGPARHEANRLLRDTRSLRAATSGNSLKAGKPYTRRRLDGAVALIHRDLAKQHRLASQLRLGKPLYHPDTNRADISIGVDQGPVVNVSVTGAKLSWVPFLSAHRLKQLVPIFSEGSIDPDLVELGRRNLADFFQNKGYFDVEVTTQLQQQPSRVTLVYTIKQNLRHRVQSVTFRGNQHIDQDDLRQQIAIQQHHFLSRGKFSDKLLKQTVSSLTAFYKNRGFEDVKVNPDVVHYDVHHEARIYVNFLITEGPQTLVNNLTVEGDGHISTPELTPSGGFRLRPGQPFSPVALAKDRNDILATYFNRGYLNSEFDSKISEDPKHPTRVDITYRITEKQQVHVDQVLLLGNKQTQPQIIRKTATVLPEAPLSQGNMLNAESKLYELGVFDWASVDPRRPVTDQSNEDVLIKLHESKRNELNYGFGLEVAKRGGNVPSGTVAIPGLPLVALGTANFTSSEKTFVSPRGSVEYIRHNMRARAETLAASVLLSRLDQRLLTTYTSPHFRLSSWDSLLSASVERTTQNPIFEARLGELSWQLEKPLNKDKSRRIQLRYRFRRTVLSNLIIPQLVLPQDRKLRLPTLSATWIRDTRDKPLDASKGFYETFDLGITPRALGSTANFVRFLGQTAYYRPFGPTVWANSIRLGLAKSFARSDVPTSERFFTGGETSLRGFPINGAGPQRIVPVCSNPADPTTCKNISVPVGGDQLFIFNSEFRFPLGIKEGLYGAVFYDGGNVYGPINISRFLKNYTNTIGIGARYSTPVGPIRFDVGRLLEPIPGIRPYQFFVTLGQAF